MQSTKRGKPKTLICECCEKKYIAFRSTAKYCSKTCKNKMAFKRRKIRVENAKLNKGINPFFLKRGDVMKNLSTGVPRW